MARWIMLAVALAGLLLAFLTKSPGLLGVGLLLAFVGVVGFVFALAADRIAANARPEASMASIEDFSSLRTQAGARRIPPSARSISDNAADTKTAPPTSAPHGADVDRRT